MPYLFFLGFKNKCERAYSMPAKKVVDHKKLVKAVARGTHQSEIMKEFGFKTPTQLKLHYLSSLVETGMAPVLVSGRVSKQKAPANDVVVNKRGSVVVAKRLIEEIGYVEGDTLKVRRTKSGLSLKKLK